MSLARNVHKTLLTGWKACFCLLVLAASSAAGAAPEDATPLFIVDSPFDPPAATSIYQVDPATGDMTLRANLGSAYTPSLAIAAASDTVLYAAATDSSGTLCQTVSCLLLRIVLAPSSTTPLSVTIVGAMHAGSVSVGGVTGLTFRADGSLYALSQANSGIYVLDPETAGATLVGLSNVELHGGDITFDGEDHLWAWTNGQIPGLYEVDPATGFATAVDTDPPDSCAGLAALGHSNILYAASTLNDSLHQFEAGVGSTGVIAPLTLNGNPFDHKRGDLDSPFCAEGAFCDDGNACTDDACTPGGCHHTARPGCCTTSADCDDQNPCTTDTCDGAGAAATCGHAPLSGGQTTCGIGACLRTVTTCIAGAPQSCVPGAPSPETCNGIDDDCDINVDEDVPAPAAVPALHVTGGAETLLTWSPVPGAVDYDAVNGALSALKATHGDFTTSTTHCLVSRFGGTSLDVEAAPAPGDGFWLLVRAGSCSTRGSWDEPDPALAAPRDPEIQASPFPCP